MGLFDMFGVGGGRVAVQPQSMTASAGSMLGGQIGFQGGSRPQNITKLTIRLVMDQTQMEMTPQGPQQRTHSRDVIPETPVSGPFQSTPNQVQQFPFNLQIPQGLPNSTPGQVKYRLVVGADIAGEIDPGANQEIQIVGGQQMMPQAMPGQMPGMMPGQMPGMMPGQMPGMMPGQMPGMPMTAPMAGPLGVGALVMGQYQDGSWQPGRIVAMQSGMFGVDWDNPKLGASTWLQPQQVQPRQGGMPMQAPMGQPMMGQPMGGGYVDPMAKDKDAMMAKDKMGGGYGAPAMAPMGGLAMGANVMAQHKDGNWYPGRVVGMQNGMIAVDWHDAKLGASMWLQAHQVQAGGKK